MKKNTLLAGLMLICVYLYCCGEHKGSNTYNDRDEGSTTVNSNRNMDNSDNVTNDSTKNDKDSSEKRP
jgi:hypothetical protein